MQIMTTIERAVSHDREFGKFIVVYRSTPKVFDSLVKAFIFYYHLEEEASLWDVTVEAELLEKKISIGA